MITHHQVADTRVACTADYPVVETTVPLGSDFEPGVQYTVRVKLGHGEVIWWSFALSAKPAGACPCRKPGIAPVRPVGGVDRLGVRPLDSPEPRGTWHDRWAAGTMTTCQSSP